MCILADDGSKEPKSETKKSIAHFKKALKINTLE